MTKSNFFVYIRYKFERNGQEVSTASKTEAVNGTVCKKGALKHFAYFTASGVSTF